MSDRGFSLVETLIACAIAIVSLCPLPSCWWSRPCSRRHENNDQAMLLAGEKMEQLRSFKVGTDTGLNPTPPASSEQTPPARWNTSMPGSAARQSPVSPPASAVFVRRWSVEPLAADPIDSIVIGLRVMRRPPSSGSDRPTRGEARLFNLRPDRRGDGPRFGVFAREMLVAVAVASGVAAGLLLVVDVAQAGFQVQAEAADLEQRLRVGSGHPSPVWF